MRGERDDNDVRDAGGWHVKGDRRLMLRTQGSESDGLGLIVYNFLFVEAKKKDHGNLPLKKRFSDDAIGRDEKDPGSV